MGNRVFGCDICQEVCPWNDTFARPAEEVRYRVRSDLDGPTLVDLAERLLAMDDRSFREGFRRSPVSRAGRAGMLRNVCVALGNWGGAEAVPVLSAALSDPAALVRSHAAWALGEIDSPAASDALSRRHTEETDGQVREELSAALRGPGGM
jgi:epoxyqueuosine reductase